MKCSIEKCLQMCFEKLGGTVMRVDDSHSLLLAQFHSLGASLVQEICEKKIRFLCSLKIYTRMQFVGSLIDDVNHDYE